MSRCRWKDITNIDVKERVVDGVCWIHFPKNRKIGGLFWALQWTLRYNKMCRKFISIWRSFNLSMCIVIHEFVQLLNSTLNLFSHKEGLSVQTPHCDPRRTVLNTHTETRLDFIVATCNSAKLSPRVLHTFFCPYTCVSLYGNRLVPPTRNRRRVSCKLEGDRVKFRI